MQAYASRMDVNIGFVDAHGSTSLPGNFNVVLPVLVWFILSGLRRRVYARLQLRPFSQ